MEAYENSLTKAAQALTEARDLISRDLTDYPTPVSGCDAQYNRLISDRTRITNALAVLADRPFVATPRVMELGAKVESR